MRGRSSRWVHVAVLGVLAALPEARAAEPYARSGFALEVRGGGNKAMGGGSDGLDIGYRIAGAVGYELQLGSRIGVTPQLLVTYDRWGLKAGLDASQSSLGFFPGAKVAFYFGRIAPWVAAHFGYGRAAAQILTADVTKSGFGVNLGFGLDVMVLRNFGVGVAAAITKVVVEETASGQIGTQGISFGLNLKLKL